MPVVEKIEIARCFVVMSLPKGMRIGEVGRLAFSVDVTGWGCALAFRNVVTGS